MFGGFCLLFFAVPLVPPCWGAVFCDASFGVVIVRSDFSDSDSCWAFLGLVGFCLESLILAQDERWRRA